MIWRTPRGAGSGLSRRVGLALAGGGVAALLLGLGSWAAGARINTTRSIPLGLYWTSGASVERGAYVLFCPPPGAAFEAARARGYIGAGFCPGEYGYLMKRVLAAAGDAVSVGDDGVRVNGELVPSSRPLEADRAGRELPRFRAERRTLGASELLLMSDTSGASFDARYFGPVSRAQVVSVLRPVLTW